MKNPLLSSSFRESGGKIESFSNWRPTEADALKTIVEADSPNELLKTRSQSPPAMG